MNELAFHDACCPAVIPHDITPSLRVMFATNENLLDAQCGYEKRDSTMLAYLAGHDMMCDASLNANGVTSLDSVVIQDEVRTADACKASRGIPG